MLNCVALQKRQRNSYTQAITVPREKLAGWREHNRSLTGLLTTLCHHRKLSTSHHTSQSDTFSTRYPHNGWRRRTMDLLIPTRHRIQVQTWGSRVGETACCQKPINRLESHRDCQSALPVPRDILLTCKWRRAQHKHPNTHCVRTVETLWTLTGTVDWLPVDVRSFNGAASDLSKTGGLGATSQHFHLYPTLISHQAKPYKKR